MKILTEKEQLRLKLNEINESIEYSANEADKARKRKQKKDNWGFFSFIIDEYWLLDFKHKKKVAQLELLKEYGELISDRLIKS